MRSRGRPVRRNSPPDGRGWNRRRSRTQAGATLAICCKSLPESFISPVFETSESCKTLQNIAIPDRETGLIKALQADAAKKATAKQGSHIASTSNFAPPLTGDEPAKPRLSKGDASRWSLSLMRLSLPTVCGNKHSTDYGIGQEISGATWITDYREGERLRGRDTNSPYRLIDPARSWRPRASESWRRLLCNVCHVPITGRP
jgi:hypothetical protein